MKTSHACIRYALVAVGGIALSLPLVAGNGSKTEKVASQFKEMDQNGDGMISASEHASGAQRMFAKMDQNNDGQVTAAEMQSSHKAVTGHESSVKDMAAADKIRAIDTNGDGILTAAEHAAGSQEMFAKMDSNHDGSLSLEEMSAGHKKLMHKNQGAQ